MTAEEAVQIESSERQWHENLQHQSKMNLAIAQEEHALVSILKPRIFLDGNQWCVLWGDNIQDGVAGFGKTPYLAILNFNQSMHKEITPRPPTAQEVGKMGERNDEFDRSIICVWCGETIVAAGLDRQSVAKALALTQEHDRQCLKNPLTAENARLRGLLKETIITDANHCYCVELGAGETKPCLYCRIKDFLTPDTGSARNSELRDRVTELEEKNLKKTPLYNRGVGNSEQE